MKKILEALSGQSHLVPPIWMMRQAGRYLPEYKATRSEAGSFLNLCYDPIRAAEVTIQPIRRFGFDAAILFADILLVPHAMGCDLAFETGEGPRMTPIQNIKDLNRLSDVGALTRLESIGETVVRTKEQLDSSTTLIGFAGAPWTVATYVVGGRGGDEQYAARLMMRENPELLHTVMKRITDVTIDYLAMQAQAGAEVLKIFDSWASGLTRRQFDAYVVQYHNMIIQGLREKGVNVPIIGFPRGAGVLAQVYLDHVPVQGLALDTAFPIDLNANNVALQGNLDPLALIAGGDALNQEIDDVLESFKGRAHIFNLSHGIKPETPIEHVEQMISRIRNKNVV